jgi:hypothetical protein
MTASKTKLSKIRTAPLLKQLMVMTVFQQANQRHRASLANEAALKRERRQSALSDARKAAIAMADLDEAQEVAQEVANATKVREGNYRRYRPSCIVIRSRWLTNLRSKGHRGSSVCQRYAAAALASVTA